MKELRIRTVIRINDISTDLKWSIWNDIIEVDKNRIVLFNTLSQNAILINKEELSKIPTNLRFRELGFVVGSDLEESSSWESTFKKAVFDKSYIDLTVLLTHNCQMKCQYCFEGQKDGTSLSEKTGHEIIRYLESHKEIGNRLRITWFGGEPLLSFDTLYRLSRQFIKFCDINNWTYSADITTNGFALTKSRCQKLVNECLVKRYIITIDGPEEIHNRRRPMRSGKPSFDIIWRNIGILIDSGAWVTLRMTIDRENVLYIPTLLHKIADSNYAGKVGLSFCRTIDYNFTPDNVRSDFYTEREFAEIEWSFIQQAHQLGLYAYDFPHAAPNGGCLRQGDIVIGADGIVYKCLDTVGCKQWSICEFGEMNSLKKIPDWYVQWLEWTPSKSKDCAICVLRPLCNGGCPHNALFKDKKHGSETQCPDWRSNYRKQIIALVKEMEL